MTAIDTSRIVSHNVPAINAANNSGYSPYIPVMQLAPVQAMVAAFDAIRHEADEMFVKSQIDLKPNWELAPNRNRAPTEPGQTMYVGKNFTAHLRVVNELLVPKEQELCAQPGAEERRERRRKMNPTLMSILDPIIDQVGNIGFNRLYPGAKIAPHYGVSTNYFRVHMALYADPGCTFYVEGGVPYVWKEREIMAFADGHWLHWVEHNGVNQRTILAVDFHKDMLGELKSVIPNRVI